MIAAITSAPPPQFSLYGVHRDKCSLYNVCESQAWKGLVVNLWYNIATQTIWRSSASQNTSNTKMKHQNQRLSIRLG
jgi:hypothetical protein